jgi:hypothetical protein
MAAPYVLFCLSAAPTPAMAEAGRAAVRGVVEAVAPWTVPQLYANFADRRFDVSTVHALEVWERLRGLREVLDPDGVWLANHPVA